MRILWKDSIKKVTLNGEPLNLEPGIYNPERRDLQRMQVPPENYIKGREFLLDKTGTIVKEPSTADAINWGSVNRPFEEDKFDALWEAVESYISQSTHYVSNLHIGQDSDHYIAANITTETAWHSFFANNMSSIW